MGTKLQKIEAISIKIGVSVLLIFLGNLFWYILIQNLSSSHILTSSTIKLLLPLFYPIMVFSLYLSCCVVFSTFVKSRLIWLLVILLSMADYFLLTGLGYLNLVGEMAITIALFLFLVKFHKYEVLNGGKPSLTGRISQSLSVSSLVISITLAINFYSIYTQTLSSNSLIISNRLLSSMLTPVVAIYNDDLKINNPNEKFGDYQQRLAKETSASAQQVKVNTLNKLKIINAGNDQTMKDLIKSSLDHSVLKLARNYGKTVPILISLGLGIIVQTLISVSSMISIYLTLGIFLLFRKLKITKVINVNYQVEKDVWID